MIPPQDEAPRCKYVTRGQGEGMVITWGKTPGERGKDLLDLLKKDR